MFPALTPPGLAGVGGDCRECRAFVTYRRLVGGESVAAMCAPLPCERDRGLTWMDVFRAVVADYHRRGHRAAP